MRIIHIITSLDAGGAQWVLIHVLGQLKAAGLQQAVISLKSGGELARQVRDLDIQVFEIPFAGISFFHNKSQVEAVIASFQPDILQSWMYHANFLTNFLDNPRKIPVVWGIHHTFENLSRNRLKLMTRLIVGVTAIYSHFIPQKVICCSTSALNSHARLGYATAKLVAIPNGIDTESFQPRPQAGERLRQELGLAADTSLVGLIARYHPQKDHALFFSAANRALETNPKLHFVLAGDRITRDNPEMEKWLRQSRFPDHFHLLGRRNDLPAITPGLDLATLTSSGDEAFPLTMIEAMACGVPCIATDVGDIRSMLGPDGVIVPPQDARALSAAWLSVLGQSPDARKALGVRLRARVLQYFTTQVMVAEYEKIYAQVSPR